MSDYPSKSDLKKIKTWPFSDPKGALDFVAECWSDYGSVDHALRDEESAFLRVDQRTKDYLCLATGGWSGNEDLIEALMENTMVWTLTWQLSARGGLYIFKYP